MSRPRRMRPAFVALDFETANRSVASICEIGIATVCGHRIVERWAAFIDPSEEFDAFNTRLHGIDSESVEGSPSLAAAWPEVRRRLHNRIVVSHTEFDRRALASAVERHDLDPPRSAWLDSLNVARRAWPEQAATGGFALDKLALRIGVPLRHHDALEDACAAARIVLAASAETGLDASEWLERTQVSEREWLKRRRAAAPTRP